MSKSNTGIRFGRWLTIEHHKVTLLPPAWEWIVNLVRIPTGFRGGALRSQSYFTFLLLAQWPWEWDNTVLHSYGYWYFQCFITAFFWNLDARTLRAQNQFTDFHFSVYYPLACFIQVVTLSRVSDGLCFDMGSSFLLSILCSRKQLPVRIPWMGFERGFCQHLIFWGNVVRDVWLDNKHSKVLLYLYYIRYTWNNKFFYCRARKYLGDCIILSDDVCFVFVRVFTLFSLTTQHYEDIMYNTGHNQL